MTTTNLHLAPPPPTKTGIHETGAQAGLTVIEKELSFSLFVQWLRRRKVKEERDDTTANS